MVRRFLDIFVKTVGTYHLRRYIQSLNAAAVW